MVTKSHIKLPVQVLNWSRIKNPGNLLKIVFQFEIKASGNGNKTFQLVAYPAYKTRGVQNFGKKIPLDIKKYGKTRHLKLPVTLGNLEIGFPEILHKLKVGKNASLEFTPNLYMENPHAGYIVSDGTNSITVNPSPPAKPGGF